MPSLLEPNKDTKANGSRAGCGGGSGGVRSKSTNSPASNHATTGSTHGDSPRKGKRTDDGRPGSKEDSYILQRFNQQVETHELTALGQVARPRYSN
ncbi:hypothetical protein B0A55_00176 [Friedmanniomyces simplex]|uniref:Uncharacterized protein n=1 Tax=Friedmanniomyces simplex TaxID=329884 RepID=A0A4V5NKF4_9PEZI|nr:hypothetical protein B0A55_00176 [Friedmanniomyces simplex]